MAHPPSQGRDPGWSGLGPATLNRPLAGSRPPRSRPRPLWPHATQSLPLREARLGKARHAHRRRFHGDSTGRVSGGLPAPCHTCCEVAWVRVFTLTLHFWFHLHSHGRSGTRRCFRAHEEGGGERRAGSRPAVRHFHGAALSSKGNSRSGVSASKQINKPPRAVVHNSDAIQPRGQEATVWNSSAGG